MQHDIPIDELFEPRATLRALRKNTVEYVELVESIRKDGVLQPLLVRPYKKGYEIVEGRYRYAASLQCGLSSIPCLVKEMSDKEALVIQLKCNAIRPKTNRYEYARRLRRLIKDADLTVGELSVMVGKSTNWVQDHLKLLRLCSSAQKPVDNGEITLKAALALASMPVPLQEKFVEEALSMPTADFVERAGLANREYNEYLTKGKFKSLEKGYNNPYLRTMADIAAENEDDVKTILEMCDAKTPQDGWRACKAWVLHLDPLTIKRKREGVAEEKSARLKQHEKRIRDRKLIEQLVLQKPELGESHE